MIGSRFIILITLAICMAPSGAVAHAHLDRSIPVAGSEVAQAPQQVVIWFTKAVEPAFSTIEVKNAQGAAMQVGKAAADTTRTRLSVPLKPLPPGTYKVIWRVLSVDTHRTQGDFSFRVGP